MNNALKSKLKSQAHHLNPVILVGAQGLTEAVIKETDFALEAHELIKVKINGEDKGCRKEAAMQMCDSLHAEFIQLIGNIAIIYRKKKK